MRPVCAASMPKESMATTAVSAEAPPEDAQPAGRSKKRLILIVAGVALVLLLGGGGGAAWWMLKKSPKADEDTELAEADGDGHADETKAKKKNDKKHAPVFLPLETFTVNLGRPRGRALRAGRHHAGAGRRQDRRACSRPTCRRSATTS